MLGRRRRQRANIKTTVGQCLVLAGIILLPGYRIIKTETF